MSISLKDLGLTLEDLKAVAEVRGIKEVKKKGKKPKTTFFKSKIEKIRKEFNESRYKFSKLII